jgi:hypothetical protein
MLSRYSCKVGNSELERRTDSVMRLLASLPLLSEFSFSLTTSNYQPLLNLPFLNHLKNLKELSVKVRDNNVIPGIATAIANSPELQQLDFSYKQHYGYGEVPRLQDLFANIRPDSPPLKLRNLGATDIRLSVDASIIPHPRSLTSLELTGTIEEDSSVAIWQMLTSKGILLSRLVTNAMNDELLDYLSLLHGMTELRLVCVMENNDNNDDSGRFARRFFQDVLPRQTDTLKVLYISAAHEDDWVGHFHIECLVELTIISVQCFGKHNRVSIMNCTKLEELAITIHWPRIVTQSFFMYDYSNRSPVVSDHISLAFPNSNRTLSTTTKKDLLLNTASQLHCLRSLEIIAALMRNFRHRYLFGDTTYRNDVYTAILKVVDRFKLDGDDDVTGLVGYELYVDEDRFFVPRT